MANVSHASLSGSNVHEPKGIAGASANQVYVSNGAGSGVWQQAPAAAISPSAIAFSQALFHVREEQSSGTFGTGSFTGSTFNTRPLNIIKTNQTGVPTLVSNQMTLPAGTWMCMGWTMGQYATFGSSGVIKPRLRNITGTADLLIGSSEFYFNSTSGTQINIKAHINGVFTLGVSSVVELQAWILSLTAPFSDSAGVVEVYSEVMLWKIA